ncbi:MAG TPA: glycosyltransferase family 4 protein [Actinomycetota bacterium]|nr:glycosyltransferase family 4 protein [Actinomycetota bacterium]
MRILLWHGYLLSGSGSNVYTANVARQWRSQGHHVVLMCQDRNAASLDFVDRTFIGARDWQSVRDPGGGRCDVVVPDIGGLLPVYVYDDYEGFEVKTFPELTDTELTRYTELNLTAMVDVIEAFSPDAVITGHEVMGPEIARRACGETGRAYTAKLHGSALEYAVKKQERYRRYAIDGLGAARRVIGGSRYMVDEAARVIPGWEARSEVINPGCDVGIFRPAAQRPHGPFHIGFVGKLIPSKGVHNLLVAVGLADLGDVKLTIVGYGGSENDLEELAAALRGDDRPAVHRSLTTIGGAGSDVDDELVAASAAGIRRVDVEFPGRLEHDRLQHVLPHFDVLVAPSVLPEAFGMVVAEAAASGVLCIVPDHSGIGEAGRAVEDAIAKPGLLRYDPRDPIRDLATALRRVASFPATERRELGLLAASLARTRWSWGHVADRLLQVATSG